MTGGRIKLANNLIKNKDNFLMTYCDGLANVDINKLINKHKLLNKLVTVTAVQPRHRYGVMNIKKNIVTKFNNTNPIQNVRVNGGYFIINPKSLKFVKNKKIFWENEPMNYLIKKKN